jgi:hypothetical protein
VNNGRAKGLRGHAAALACCGCHAEQWEGSRYLAREIPSCSTFDSLQNL